MQKFISKTKELFSKTKEFLINSRVKKLTVSWANRFKSKMKTFCKLSVFSKIKAFPAVLTTALVSWWHLILAGLVVFLVLYYPLGAFLTHTIDKDFEFNKQNRQTNQTQILDTAAALIDREVNKHSWTPNLPFFYPSAVLDNMPAFQKGIIAGLVSTVNALTNGMPDAPFLKKAAESLQTDPTIWYFSQETPANKQYLAARYYLHKAAQDINNGAGIPSTAPAALLDAQITGLDKVLDMLKTTLPVYNDSPLDAGADEIFYQAQGQAYVYYLVLRDLPVDFPELSANEAAMRFYNEALKTLKAALTFDPTIIRSAAPDSPYAPNHPAVLGFYLSEVQNDLQAMMRVLNK